MAVSAGNPRLSNPIKSDVPEIQQKEAALLKMDPTNVSDLEVGSKRLTEISSGNWQFQAWNGSQWVNVGKLQMDVDTVDSYHASITPNANTVAVRGSDGKLQDSITGNAATATSAATLSETLVVGKGGTGATTSKQARSNLGVPPTSHASTNNKYGISSETAYGHAKASSDAPAQDTDAGAVGTKTSEFARGDHAHKKVLGNADTYGQVKLTDSVSDGSDASSSVAASAKAVKTAYDKAVTIMTGATASAAGTSGNVPAPQAGEQDFFLRGDGTWAVSAGLPLGHLFTWPFSTPPDGSIVVNGATYSRTLYADLWTYISSKSDWVKTESEWQSIASANNGYCPYYSDGDGSTTFRVPKFAPYQQIYGKSDTVQPESNEWIVCVVAYGKAANVGNVDVANVMSAVGTVQSELTNYLPTAGGTLKGQLIFNTPGTEDYIAVIRAVNDANGARFTIDTWEEGDVGAYIALRKGSSANNPGGFEIGSRNADGSIAKVLAASVDGNLLWDGKQIVHSGFKLGTSVYIGTLGVGGTYTAPSLGIFTGRWGCGNVQGGTLAVNDSNRIDFTTPDQGYGTIRMPVTLVVGAGDVVSLRSAGVLFDARFTPLVMG